MGFNEKVHAYIAAKYYAYLTDRFGERGREAFVHATMYYAGQRGRRMAQRAIRDGQPLNFTTYQRYGEWVNTEEVKESGESNLSEVISYEPEAVIHYTRCPWNEQFKAMGLNQTAGAEYCRHLDSAIARGFNPYLSYEVDQSLQTEDFCIHRLKDPGFDRDTDLTKNPERMKSFEYHCAHSFWAYSEVTSAIFGIDGESVSADILHDFEEDYGREMAETLMKYRYTNFNVCD